MKILISKYGAVFRTRENARTGSPTGEVGETEGLIRYLIQQGHDVSFFGQMRGEIEGCRYVESNVKGLTSGNFVGDPDEQKERWAKDIEDIGERPGMFINVAGFAPTMSFIDNPRHNNVYATGVNYCAPLLNVYRHFKLPRIVVNNDPRTYPRDMEMSLLDDILVPAAVLDQASYTIKTKIGGVQYKRHSAYAACESWAYLDKYENTDKNACIVLAHAHIKDGCRQKDRSTAWDTVIDDDYPVYGKGWEDQDVNWKGHVNPREVFDILKDATCCPCVAQRNFYTGKIFVLNSCDCIPLLFGDGTSDFTWDPLEKYESLGSPWRIREHGDLRRLAKRLHSSADDRLERRHYWDTACRPDFTLLDQLIDYVENDGVLPAWHLFGGYERLKSY